MSALEDALEEERKFVTFEQELKDSYLKRSFISMSSGSSFNPDECRDRKSTCGSSNDEFNDAIKRSRFFINTASKEIDESNSNHIDFVSNDSPKSSDYLPPNIYKPAYLYKKYKYADLFRLEILNVFIYTFLCTNAQLVCVILSVPAYIAYFFRIGMHGISLLLTMLLTSNEESSRSINIIPEFMMINAILFNYSVLDILVYFCIQILVSFLTNITIFAIFYGYIKMIPSEYLSHTLIHYSTQSIYISTVPIYSSLIIYTITTFLMSSIFTQMIDRLTSIEYKKIIYYKMLVFLTFNIIFTASIGYVSSMGYNISAIMAMILIKLDTLSINHDLYMILYLLPLSLIVPYVSAYIGISYIRNFYNKYIEI